MVWRTSSATYWKSTATWITTVLWVWWAEEMLVSSCCLYVRMSYIILKWIMAIDENELCCIPIKNEFFRILCVSNFLTVFIFSFRVLQNQTLFRRHKKVSAQAKKKKGRRMKCLFIQASGRLVNCSRFIRTFFQGKWMTFLLDLWEEETQSLVSVKQRSILLPNSKHCL